MIEYIDIPSLLNFSLENIDSVKQLQQVEKEILSRFELTDKKTIRFKDKLFNREEVVILLNIIIENAPSYIIIKGISGLTKFMKSAVFLDIDYKKLLALDQEQKEAIKPFMNYGYFQLGKKLINQYESVTPDELFNLSQFTSELKGMGTYYIDEAQDKIDQEWNEKLLVAKKQYLDIKPLSTSAAEFSIHSMSKWIDMDQSEYITEFTKPYELGNKEFYSCVIKIVSYSVDSVDGNLSLYSQNTIKNISKIVNIICLSSPIQLPNYNKLKDDLRSLSIDKTVVNFKLLGYIIIAVIFLISMMFLD